MASSSGSLSDDSESSDGEQVNEMYETIGSKILELWDLKRNQLPEVHTSFHAHPIQRLQEILCCEPNTLPPRWTEEMDSIIEVMTPADFAIHGKRIARFFLKFHYSLPRIGSSRRKQRPEMSISSISFPRIQSQRQVKAEPYRRAFPKWLPTNTD
jgi:hypothetical protein